MNNNSFDLSDVSSETDSVFTTHSQYQNHDLLSEVRAKVRENITRMLSSSPPRAGRREQGFGSPGRGGGLGTGGGAVPVGAGPTTSAGQATTPSRSFARSYVYQPEQASFLRDLGQRPTSPSLTPLGAELFSPVRAAGDGSRLGHAPVARVVDGSFSVASADGGAGGAGGAGGSFGAFRVASSPQSSSTLPVADWRARAEVAEALVEDLKERVWKGEEESRERGREMGIQIQALKNQNESLVARVAALEADLAHLEGKGIEQWSLKELELLEHRVSLALKTVRLVADDRRHGKRQIQGSPTSAKPSGAPPLPSPGQSTFPASLLNIPSISKRALSSHGATLSTSAPTVVQPRRVTQSLVLCDVCSAAPATVPIAPCGHHSCRPCIEAAERTAKAWPGSTGEKRCPKCRTRVQGVI